MPSMMEPAPEPRNASERQADTYRAVVTWFNALQPSLQARVEAAVRAEKPMRPCAILLLQVREARERFRRANVPIAPYLEIAEQELRQALEPERQTYQDGK